MHLARVTGAVVSTQKSPSLNGKTAAGAPGKRGRRSSDSPHERR